MTAPFVDRRDVLKLGGAAALMLLWPPARAEALRPSSLATSTIVLADRRYAESLLFAESLVRQGARVVPLTSGAGGAWYGAGRRKSAAVAAEPTARLASAAAASVASAAVA